MLVSVALAVPAAAHLALRTPPSRYGDTVLKTGPCGRDGGARSANVAVLEAGSRLDVVWDEYIDHPGHFRISFDADGDDDFIDPLCLDECDSQSMSIELYSNHTVLADGIADTQGGVSRATVRLPDVECDNCTLQVIQVMYDKPPFTIPGNDIYYQCADLVLRRSPALPTPTPCTLACEACAGDCDASGTVTIDELITLVRIALDRATASECQNGDTDASGTVEIDELVTAVQKSLNGC